MIYIGDTVKVINGTKFNGMYVSFYPIGTICKVVEKDYNGAIGIVPIEVLKVNSNATPYFYMENELEKGRLKWVKC